MDAKCVHRVLIERRNNTLALSAPPDFPADVLAISRPSHPASRYPGRPHPIVCSKIFNASIALSKPPIPRRVFLQKPFQDLREGPHRPPHSFKSFIFPPHTDLIRNALPAHAASIRRSEWYHFINLWRTCSAQFRLFRFFSSQYPATVSFAMPTPSSDTAIFIRVFFPITERHIWPPPSFLLCRAYGVFHHQGCIRNGVWSHRRFLEVDSIVKFFAKSQFFHRQVSLHEFDFLAQRNYLGSGTTERVNGNIPKA